MMMDLPRHWFQNTGAFKSLKFGNFILYEPGCISVKPKIPCSAGLVPVMIDDHATEDISGIEDSIGVKNPSWIIWRVCGMMPVSAKSLSIPKGTPSRPIITVFAFLVVISVHHNNYAAGTYVFVADKNKTPKLLNIVEVFDGHRLFGFDNDFRNLEILQYFSVFFNNFER